jgi:lysophospholipase L1-like esterase
MARAGSIAGQGLLLIASLVFALGIAEAVLRWRSHAVSLPPAEQAPEKLRELRTMRELVQPNVSGRFSGAPYRTNRFGFRGPDVAETPLPGVVRIEVIGDSFTAGIRLSEEQAYPALLQELLNGGGNGRYEVLNLGVPGASLRFSLKRLAELGLRLRPRTVVYGFTLNDIEGPHYRKRRREPSPEGPGFAARCAIAAPLHVVRLGCTSWASIRGGFFPSPDSYVGELKYNYLENRDAWADFTAQLATLRALTRDRGICLHVLIHEQLQGWRWPRPQRLLFDRVVEAAEQLGIGISDRREAFSHMPFERVRLSAIDPHPNREGHEVLARALYEGFESLPERCLRAASPERAGR